MKISIIVPAGHKDEDFSLIDQIREKFKDFEIILAASYQNSKAKEQENKVDQLISIHNSTKAKALNAGAEIAKNDLLWFLNLESDLSLIDKIDLSKIIENKINTFLLIFKDNELKYNSKGINLKSKYLGLSTGKQSFIIHKKIFNFIGQFTESLEKNEDINFIWKAKKIGIKVNIVEKFIINSSIKYTMHPVKQILDILKNIFTQMLNFQKPRSRYVICHFVKDPISKKSKPKLREELSEEFVNEINESMIEIVNNNIEDIKKNDFIHQIIVSEIIHKKYAYQFSKKTNGLYLTSQNELGKSMKEVIEFNLKYFQKVVIVGMDIPFLTADDIMESLKIKSAKNIFYPTLDGGFCLLTTSDKSILQVIANIKYGTNSALRDLTNNVSKLLIHNKFYQDIDVKEDLVSVYKALKEKVYSLNNLQKKLYTLLYSKQKEFLH